jgi:hypothetical protein
MNATRIQTNVGSASLDPTYVRHAAFGDRLGAGRINARM